MRYALILLLCFASSAFAAEVITLKYKQAEEVIPLIKPFLSKGGAISGTGNQLILRTGNMREIRKIIAKLDRAPRNLDITVYQGENPGDGSSETYSTESNGENASHVRVMEGRPAFVRTGQGVQDNAVFVGPYGSGVSTQYREVTNGFYVAAHLQGDLVTLEISPVMDRPSPQGVDLQRLSTTVSGKIGEWIALGGSEKNLDSGSIHTGSGKKIWIRVELP